MSNCKQKGCTGKYRVVTSYYVHGDTKKRHRKCDVCGFEDYTIEISAKNYERMRKLIIGLKILLRDYMGE